MKTLIKITVFSMMLLTSFSIQAQVNLGIGSGTSGSNRTFVGQTAGRINTGANNSFFGRNAGYDNTTGYSNTFAGSTAGRFNTTGIENSFFGRGSGYFNTTGRYNVFLGTYSGYGNTTASYNVFVGERAGRFNTTGASNTFMGRRAGYSNTTGGGNSFIGRDAGYFNTTGNSNVFLGILTGYANTTANYNTFVGERAGRFNTTGVSNAFLGRRSGYSNTTGGNNVFIGANTGYDNTTGGNNTFIGQAAGRFNTIGQNNTMLGYRAGYNATGTRNVFIGYTAGYNETGDNKLYIDNTSTANPLIKGDFSTNTLTFNGDVGIGEDIPTGSTVPTDISLYVRGRFAQEFSGTIGSFGSNDRWSSLGTSFAPSGSIPTVYGMINQWGDNSLISGVKDGTNSTLTWTGPNARLDFDYFNTSNFTAQTHMSVKSNGNVGIGFTNPQFELDVNGSIRVIGSYFGSDKRYKENIKGIENAMDKINALDGVTYNFKAGEINGYNFKTITNQKQIGFIAQDVKKVFPELVDADENDYLSVNYVAIIPVLTEAIKEQQDVIDEQETLIDEQQQEMIQQQEQIIDLQSRMERLEALLTDSQDIRDSSLPSNENPNIAGVMLRQNAPNPFSNRTTIQYELPDKLGVASLVVYDLNSRQIATYSIAGKGSIEFDASGLPNGTYGYAIIANGKSIAVQKMIIQK